MDIPHQPDWDERVLELGKPAIMDTPTLIEWIQRQLETPEETQNRRDEMAALHKEWHRTGAGRFGIYTCCITTSVFTMNEKRSIDATSVLPS